MSDSCSGHSYKDTTNAEGRSLVASLKNQLDEKNKRIAKLEERYERLQFFWSWGGAEKAHERVWQIEQELEVARYRGLHYPNEDQINDFTEVIHNLRNRLGCGLAYADSLQARIDAADLISSPNSKGKPNVRNSGLDVTLAVREEMMDDDRA